ncbi:MAG TPA: SAF domain-containing protein, partial [Myxococcales bacterium]|nr:SAF domain-containing protein [Myxococcales bacterium]
MATLVRGFVLLLLAGWLGWLAYTTAWERPKRLRAQWHLVPAVVATRDLPVGARLGPDALETSTLPDAVVTKSLVSPGNRRIDGQALAVALKTGDPLHWQDLVPCRA